MGYETAWKKAKKKFEETTGKKKPSETILGLFKKSSGIEAACAALDKAADARDLDQLKKAHTTFITAKAKYEEVLDDAIESLGPRPRTEEATTYEDAIEKLRWSLQSVSRNVNWIAQCLIEEERERPKRYAALQARLKVKKEFDEAIKRIEKAEDEARKRRIKTGGMYMERWKQTRADFEKGKFSPGLLAAMKKNAPAIEKAIVDLNKAEETVKDWKSLEKAVLTFDGKRAEFWADLLTAASLDEICEPLFTAVRLRLQSIQDCSRGMCECWKQREEEKKKHLVEVKKVEKDARRQQELVAVVDAAEEDVLEEINYNNEYYNSEG
jgi:prefoldin subunit 5